MFPINRLVNEMPGNRNKWLLQVCRKCRVMFCAVDVNEFGVFYSQNRRAACHLNREALLSSKKKTKAKKQEGVSVLINRDLQLVSGVYQCAPTVTPAHLGPVHFWRLSWGTCTGRFIYHSLCTELICSVLALIIYSEREWRGASAFWLSGSSSVSSCSLFGCISPLHTVLYEFHIALSPALLSYLLSLGLSFSVSLCCMGSVIC